uniref:Uncharacterized protein n=1 Tax=Fagus sylvatica TaxID=28930 RepID=A0A2N9EQY0_FAGSY
MSDQIYFLYCPGFNAVLADIQDEMLVNQASNLDLVHSGNRRAVTLMTVLVRAFKLSEESDKIGSILVFHHCGEGPFLSLGHSPIFPLLAQLEAMRSGLVVLLKAAHGEGCQVNNKINQ